MSRNSKDHLSRRKFNGTLAAAGIGLAIPDPGLFAAGSDTVRVAMVGCGDRGTADAVYCLKSSPGVELVALARPWGFYHFWSADSCAIAAGPEP